MSGPPSLGPIDCADRGRLMFLQYVGQYFAAEPRLNRLPDGTACTICGGTSARLWLTASDEASCLAQQTITRKRAARKSADEPMIPAVNAAGSTSMGDGNMVVAGPHRALLVTKLLPDKPVPANIDIVFSDKGAIKSSKLDLFRHPPQPPFVAIIFGQKAHFSTTVTIDESRIFVNGPKKPGSRSLLSVTAPGHRQPSRRNHIPRPDRTAETALPVATPVPTTQNVIRRTSKPCSTCARLD